jgi:hypothetical protein
MNEDERHGVFFGRQFLLLRQYAAMEYRAEKRPPAFRCGSSRAARLEHQAHCT